ncbi:hypothetical protein [Clostridium saccharoperbutylacetonicum]|uniref:Uncharacterized protein n=1 Tax=Clostridium saccharoperbutylacetonicum N1-4(HMT) TaxID=931276 RepID=M1MML1_9CLOT|nr:hypothetical protein [Clostridium saccharoperbutylacetonicum]AGF57463.1 hypothetical protein Cspa_c37030 [Clostridium saccharoperbutylacetonicum N1-4(HMT)]AQR96158.1 hypothetical protein CLSAP_34770 [Clostridium saccharoperbutylacetonicum]NRT61771.1 hypothetical protein [Clostridium saccharoperbutylacetonicum]NSB25095.1 hypothetical protein [Clostridium saccharoperbutylacetonicum]NSB32029.1 hypothetical protein [Clostridium saccharoperbutylacetonicum]
MDKEIIREKIYALLGEMGFEKTFINGIGLYSYAECYYKITYIERYSSYVIEYASNYDEAVKNVFWDGDWYPISLGDALFDKLRYDLVNFYMHKN